MSMDIQQPGYPKDPNQKNRVFLLPNSGLGSVPHLEFIRVDKSRPRSSISRYIYIVLNPIVVWGFI